MKSNSEFRIPNSAKNLVGLLIVIGLVFSIGAHQATQRLEPTLAENEVGAKVVTEIVLEPPSPEPPPEPIYTPPPEDAELWLPILVYHRIDYAEEWRSQVYKSLTIEPEWLDEQLGYLRENDFESVTYKDVVDYFETGKPLPERPVMINFDDGYKDNYNNARSILKKHNYRATFFITVNLSGSKVYMTHDEVSELVADGHEIGNHTLWHPDLRKSSDEKLRAEIGHAKTKLEELYGQEVVALAYPFGKYDDRVIRVVQEAGHKIARSFSGKNAPRINRDNIFRVPVVSIWGNLPMKTWDKYLFAPES